MRPAASSISLWQLPANRQIQHHVRSSMGVVDGVYETTATDEAKFRLGTMADVCFVRGWDWSQAKSYAKEKEEQ